ERVAGVILSPTAATSQDFGPVAALGLPIVVIDRPVEAAAVDTVLIDNAAAAEELTAHLLAHGRRRVAGIFGKSFTGRLRHAGFARAHKARGLDVAKELVRWAPPRERDGYDAARALLALPEPPDAILTSNAMLAAGAYRALSRGPLACPSRVAF